MTWVRRLWTRLWTWQTGRRIDALLSELRRRDAHDVPLTTEEQVEWQRLLDGLDRAMRDPAGGE